nr:tyrosine-type recombinase/integrase [Acidimicrobiia bacterium]
MTPVNLDVAPLRESWVRSLRAAGKAPRTVTSYCEALDSFTAWCEADGRPVLPDRQQRRDVEDFIAWLIDTRSTGTAGVRYRGLRQWWRWLEREGEADDAMNGMVHPKVEETPPPIIKDEHLRALLDVTRGGRGERGLGDMQKLNARRDHAILRVLIDTGMRRGEMGAPTLDDVDLDAGVLVVRRSKTGRGRVVPLGTKAVEAVDRYLRLRARHRLAARRELWLGLHGPLTGEGVRQLILARCTEARIPPVHPHQFRHTAAHRWPIAGGQEQD